eukprot:g1456.t1
MGISKFLFSMSAEQISASSKIGKRIGTSLPRGIQLEAEMNFLRMDSRIRVILDPLRKFEGVVETSELNIADVMTLNADEASSKADCDKIFSDAKAAWGGNDWCHGMGCFQAKMRAEIPVPFSIKAGASISVVIKNPLSFKQRVEITGIPMLGGFFLGSAYVLQEMDVSTFIELGGHRGMNGGALTMKGEAHSARARGLSAVFEAGFSVKTQNILGMLGKFFLKILEVIYKILMVIIKVVRVLMSGFTWLLANIVPIATHVLYLFISAFECLIKLAFGTFLNALESDSFKAVQELMDKIFSVQEASGSVRLEVSTNPSITISARFRGFFFGLEFDWGLSFKLSLMSILSAILKPLVEGILKNVIPGYDKCKKVANKVKKKIQEAVDKVKKAATDAQKEVEGFINKVKSIL